MPQGPGETQPRPTSNEQQQQHGLALAGTMQGPDMPPLQPLVLLSPGETDGVFFFTQSQLIAPAQHVCSFFVLLRPYVL